MEKQNVLMEWSNGISNKNINSNYFVTSILHFKGFLCLHLDTRKIYNKD